MIVPVKPDEEVSVARWLAGRNGSISHATRKPLAFVRIHLKCIKVLHCLRAVGGSAQDRFGGNKYAESYAFRLSFVRSLQKNLAFLWDRNLIYRQSLEVESERIEVYSQRLLRYRFIMLFDNDAVPDFTGSLTNGQRDFLKLIGFECLDLLVDLINQNRDRGTEKV